MPAVLPFLRRFIEAKPSPPECTYRFSPLYSRSYGASQKRGHKICAHIVDESILMKPMSLAVTLQRFGDSRTGDLNVRKILSGLLLFIDWSFLFFAIHPLSLLTHLIVGPDFQAHQ